MPQSIHRNMDLTNATATRAGQWINPTRWANTDKVVKRLAHCHSKTVKL